MERFKGFRQPAVAEVFPYKEVDALRDRGFSASEIAGVFQKFVNLGILVMTQEGYVLTFEGRTRYFLSELRDLAGQDKDTPEKILCQRVDELIKKCGFGSPLFAEHILTVRRQRRSRELIRSRGF